MGNPLTNDEKFVTIEYETWKNKYEPMERQLEELRVQLRNEQESKHLTLTVHFSELTENQFTRISQTRGLHGWRYRERVEIGTIYCADRELEKVPFEIHPYTLKILRDIEIYLSDFMNLVSKDKYYEIIQQIKMETINLLKAKEENEKTIANNLSNIHNIPKFVRWIFKIKTV